MRIERLACALLLLCGLAADVAAQQAAQQAQQRTPQSWTSDRRRFSPGDVVTVIVDESTLSEQDRSESAARDRRTTADLLGAVSTGGTSTGADVGVRTGLGSSSSERGQARRENRLTAEITVRVTGVEPGGHVRVEGSKSVTVDGREQKVTLAGIVRASDISPQNAVDSWRIAELHIAYFTDGKLSEPKRGAVARVLGMIWP